MAPSKNEGARASEAFTRLGKVLRDPKQRKEFWQDPDGALGKIGLGPKDLPDSVRKTLHDLSYEELRVLARVNASLDRAGVSAPNQAEMV